MVVALIGIGDGNKKKRKTLPHLVHLGRGEFSGAHYIAC
jgi:hypothetical protein